MIVEMVGLAIIFAGLAGTVPVILDALHAAFIEGPQVREAGGRIAESEVALRGEERDDQRYRSGGLQFGCELKAEKSARDYASENHEQRGHFAGLGFIQRHCELFDTGLIHQPAAILINCSAWRRASGVMRSPESMRPISLVRAAPVSSWMEATVRSRSVCFST